MSVMVPLVPTRQGLSRSLEVTVCARLAGQEAPVTSVPYSTRITGTSMAIPGFSSGC